MACSTPGFPVPHHLLEFAQVHVHWVSNAIQLSHTLSPSSPSASNLSQHQGLFQWVSSLHQVAKVLEVQLVLEWFNFKIIHQMWNKLLLSSGLPYSITINMLFVHSLRGVWLFATPWTAARQASLSFTTSLGPCSNSCPSSWWFHPTISSSVIPFSRLQSFPASGSFPVSQLFASGGQSIRASASASVLPMNIQDWFPLGLTGLISLLSKGL